MSLRFFSPRATRASIELQIRCSRFARSACQAGIWFVVWRDFFMAPGYLIKAAQGTGPAPLWFEQSRPSVVLAQDS
jgi:hypothetical protein